MIRGTFANIRLRNWLAPGTEGGVTLHLPDREQTSIYDAAMRYQADGVPLVVLANKEYGWGPAATGRPRARCCSGSGPCWPRATSASTGPTWSAWDPAPGAAGGGDRRVARPHRPRDLRHHRPGGRRRRQLRGHRQRRQRGLTCRVRIDTPNEVEYYRHGGILQYVLRQQG